jgi:hypothetical protein
MDKDSKRAPAKRARKRIQRLEAIGEDVRTNAVEQSRTEALVTARAISLAGLPRTRTDSRDLSRTLRLGEKLWLRVTYSTGAGGVLPYGADRFVLTGIQHLAVQKDTPVVLFEETSELLKLFELPTNGTYLRLLRERVVRIRGLTITLEFAETEAGLREAARGKQSFVIEEYLLPTRDEVRCARIGQTSLPRLFDDGSKRIHRGVILSDYFWKQLQDKKNHLLLRLDILREFTKRPLGWDYYCFLAYRCRWAQSWSPVPHDALMSLFKDDPEDQDSKTIHRLRHYHDEIMTAAAGHLKAELRPSGHFRSSGGRPKERWELWVGPSEPIIHSGKRTGLFVPPEAAAQ